MARNPYTPGRDYTWPIRILLGLGIVLIVALLAVYVLRPDRTEGQAAAAAELQAEMDVSQERTDRESAAAAEQRARTL